MKQIMKTASLAKSMARGAQTGAGLGMMSGTISNIADRSDKLERDYVFGISGIGGALIGAGHGAYTHFKGEKPESEKSEIRKIYEHAGKDALKGGIAGGLIGAPSGNKRLGAQAGSMGAGVYSMFRESKRRQGKKK